MIKKHEIFDHLVDTYLYMGQQSGFEKAAEQDKYVFSRFPSPLFNFVQLGSASEDIFKKAINDNIPFICFPRENRESGFSDICKSYNMSKADEVVANSYNEVLSYNYELRSDIQIKQINTEDELKIFDDISSQVFQHPKEMSLDFLKDSLASSEITFFLAYYDGKAVGTGMLSCVNNCAGLYWLAVLPEYRKFGIGSELVKYRINQAKQRNIPVIVSQNMTPSISMYQKLGFKAAGSLPLFMYTADMA